MPGKEKIRFSGILVYTHQMEPRILLLVHHHHRDAGRVPALLRKKNLQPVIWSISREGRMPPRSEYEAMIIFGGGMTPYDTKEFPWLRGELETIERELADERPLLGICLGAQMFCHLLGGRVQPAARAEREFSPIRILRPDPLVRDMPDIFHIYNFHDQEMILPESAEEFLSGGICPQGVRFGRRAWGVQFHPEVTWRISRFWHSSLDPLLWEIGTNRKAQNRYYLPRALSQRRWGRQIIENWAREALRG